MTFWGSIGLSDLADLTLAPSKRNDLLGCSVVQRLLAEFGGWVFNIHFIKNLIDLLTKLYVKVLDLIANLQENGNRPFA
jgi:hypothetical protein